VEKDPLREDFFQNLRPKGFIATQIHVLCVNFVKFGRPEIGKVVRYLPDKKLRYLPDKKSASLSRCRFCADRAENLSGPAANNVLGVSQLSSQPVHFRRS